MVRDGSARHSNSNYRPKAFFLSVKAQFAGNAGSKSGIPRFCFEKLPGNCRHVDVAVAACRWRVTGTTTKSQSARLYLVIKPCHKRLLTTNLAPKVLGKYR
jgi:hypothetical protein